MQKGGLDTEPRCFQSTQIRPNPPQPPHSSTAFCGWREVLMRPMRFRFLNRASSRFAKGGSAAGLCFRRASPSEDGSIFCGCGSSMEPVLRCPLVQGRASPFKTLGVCLCGPTPCRGPILACWNSSHLQHLFPCNWRGTHICRCIS